MNVTLFSSLCYSSVACDLQSACGVRYVSLCVSQILILFTYRHLHVGCGEIHVNVRDRMVIFIHPPKSHTWDLGV